MEKLTPQEEELMKVIWQFGEGSIKTFLQEMPKPKPPYTTLASTIKNLEKKGFVSSRLGRGATEHRRHLFAERQVVGAVPGFVQLVPSRCDFPLLPVTLSQE